MVVGVDVGRAAVRVVKVVKVGPIIVRKAARKLASTKTVRANCKRPPHAKPVSAQANGATIRDRVHLVAVAVATAPPEMQQLQLR